MAIYVPLPRKEFNFRRSKWCYALKHLPLHLPRSRAVSKTVINFFHYGLHLRSKKSNTYSEDDVCTMCCYFLGCKCKQW